MKIYEDLPYIFQENFLLNGFNVFLLKVSDFALIIINADGTWITNNAMNYYYSTPSIQYLDIERKIQGSTALYIKRHQYTI